MIGSTYLCPVIVEIRVYLLYLLLFIILVVLIIICEEYFYFHKIFQETQEHLCLLLL